MEIFASASPSRLEDMLSGFTDVPERLALREPESGLVMVRGRICGEGRAFNLGEVLVSRSAVSIEGYLGFGYVLFGDGRHAELAAVFDALGQNPKFSTKVAQAAETLRLESEGALAAEEEATLETKVNFFTLVRGDD
jgi:alpha-D-ribose 1-methylphosphonate 5-triphosphate synthase subunit PhnG